MCTSKGFRLYTSDNCTCLIQCDSIPGGLKLCQPYRQSNLFFVVATGDHANLSSNKLLIWDQEQLKIVAEVEFLETIVDLQVKGRWVAVAHKDQVTLFDFESAEGMSQECLTLKTKIDRRRQMALEVNELEGARIAAPYTE